MRLERTYEAIFDGPPPTSWDTYKQHVKTDWQKLLSTPDIRESHVQHFLEQHPCMIPGMDAFQSSNDPGPLYGCVFTQPMLPGIVRKYPDFMWLPTDSQTQWAVLIEIEDPAKPWLTQAGQQHSKLTQAVQQVQEWRSLLAKPANQLQFSEMYRLTRARPLRFAYCLIYGRRSEVSSPHHAEVRESIKASDIVWMTFDRLQPNEAARDYLCARAHPAGDFEAVSVPATLKLSPIYAGFLQQISKKDQATKASKFMSPERKTFLAGRFQYWEAYFRNSDSPPVLGFDGE